MTRTGADDPIVAFYSGGQDHRGRTLEEILGWSDAALEAVHDYRIIQRLAALGLTAEAAALQRCLLDEVAGGGRGPVTPDTMRYWRGALTLPGCGR